MIKQLLIMFALIVLLHVGVRAQITGEPGGIMPDPSPRTPTVPADTLFIFQPARPLIDTLRITGNYRDTWGFDVLFSNSGFGVGGYYQRNFTPTVAGFINLGLTGSRKSDEFDRPMRTGDPNFPIEYRVPNKINRLYTFPLTLGIRYRVLEETLVDNFRPYINAGVGPSMIVALPYEYEFFKSIGHASGYITAGGFVGIGSEFGSKSPSLGVNIRYFYVPYQSGLESILNEPITDFGGLFLTLNVGFGG